MTQLPEWIHIINHDAAPEWVIEEAQRSSDAVFVLDLFQKDPPAYDKAINWVEKTIDLYNEVEWLEPDKYRALPSIVAVGKYSGTHLLSQRLSIAGASYWHESSFDVSHLIDRFPSLSRSETPAAALHSNAQQVYVGSMTFEPELNESLVLKRLDSSDIFRLDRLPRRPGAAIDAELVDTDSRTLAHQSVEINAYRGIVAETKTLTEPDDVKDKSDREFRRTLDSIYERYGYFYERHRGEALTHQVTAMFRMARLPATGAWHNQAHEQTLRSLVADEVMQRLVKEWKALGSASREQGDSLWRRLRGAQWPVYESRSVKAERRLASFKENIARKEAWAKESLAFKEELCAQAEAIADREDMHGAIEEMITLQEEWKKGGIVPKDKSYALWLRFKEASDRVFNNADAQLQEHSYLREQGFKDTITRERE